MQIAYILCFLLSSWLVPGLAYHVNKGNTVVVYNAQNIGDRVTSLGIDLSASYAAVAVAHHNGAQTVIARIEGDDQYKGLMKDLAKGSSQSSRASSNEYPIFFKMLKALRQRAENVLGYEIEAVLVATPNLPGERTHILDLVIWDLGLHNLDHMVKDSPHSFRQPPAAQAAAGVGMCHDPDDIDACTAEQKQMPTVYIMTILYTSNALCVEKSVMKSAYYYSPFSLSPSLMDFDLGYSERNNNPHPDYYWNLVREHILRGAVVVFPRMPKKIFLYGDLDAVSDPRLRAIIDEVMIQVTGSKVPIYDHDPEVAVVKGAAEIARRGNWPYIRDPIHEPILAVNSQPLVLQQA